MSSLLQPNLYLKAYDLKKILFSSEEYFFRVISHPEVLKNTSEHKWGSLSYQYYLSCKFCRKKLNGQYRELAEVSER